jgi:hypothetical protein
MTLPLLDPSVCVCVCLARAYLYFYIANVGKTIFI